jgi:hypothetical protein
MSRIGFLPKPGDDRQMGMHGELSSYRPAVPPYITPIGMLMLVHPCFDVLQQRKGRAHLFRRQIKHGFRVSDRNNDA